jgi:hypothetical protein
MSDMMDYYEEQEAEIDRLKLILHLKERELKAARKVVREAYQSLAYTYQGYLIEYKGTIDMSVFDRGLYDLLPNNDRAVFDALLAYETAMGGPDETSIRAALGENE